MSEMATLEKPQRIRQPYWHGWLPDHPFLSGMGSVLDIGGAGAKNAFPGLFSPDADALALLSDWTAIGSDFLAVMPRNPLPAAHDEP